MPQTPAALIPVGEVARLMSVCEATVRRYVKAGLIPPPIKLLGHTARWRRADILAAIDRLAQPDAA